MQTTQLGLLQDSLDLLSTLEGPALQTSWPFMTQTELLTSLLPCPVPPQPSPYQYSGTTIHPEAQTKMEEEVCISPLHFHGHPHFHGHQQALLEQRLVCFHHRHQSPSVNSCRPPVPPQTFLHPAARLTTSLPHLKLPRPFGMILKFLLRVSNVLLHLSAAFLYDLITHTSLLTQCLPPLSLLPLPCQVCPPSGGSHSLFLWPQMLFPPIFAWLAPPGPLLPLQTSPQRDHPRSLQRGNTLSPQLLCHMTVPSLSKILTLYVNDHSSCLLSVFSLLNISSVTSKTFLS